MEEKGSPYGLQKMSMNMFDGLTGKKERYYYEEVLRIGREKGLPGAAGYLQAGAGRS